MRITSVAAQALSELQAYAEIRNAMLRLWYGEPGARGRVVLGCDPIPLADIQPGQ